MAWGEESRKFFETVEKYIRFLLALFFYNTNEDIGDDGYVTDDHMRHLPIS
jgi:hypothetical protein